MLRSMAIFDQSIHPVLQKYHMSEIYKYKSLSIKIWTQTHKHLLDSPNLNFHYLVDHEFRIILKSEEKAVSRTSTQIITCIKAEPHEFQIMQNFEWKIVYSTSYSFELGILTCIRFELYDLTTHAIQIYSNFNEARNESILYDIKIWWRGVYICVFCLMIPGLSKDIQCHVGPYSILCMQITRSDIRPQVK